MSRDTSSFGIVARNNLRNMRSVGNENEFENLADSFPNPPPRTPLNTIPDPSQYAIKSESSKVGELLDGNVGAFDYSLAQSKGMPNTSISSGTHRSSARGKAHSEPNSAQSTPEKGVSRVSNNAVLGTSIGSRTLHYTGVRGGTSSRVSRGISVVPLPSSTEIPYFELLEDPSFWMDHNVQVLIRIRPPSPAERASQGSGRCLRQNDAQSLTWLGHPETRFTFDHIACETISQEELFQVVGVPMVENCMSGYNSCMFAYGQTGSGKTHTMMGEIFEMDGKLNESCGLTPRIFEYLFTRIKAEEENRRDEKLKYSCKCSFLEIYNEQITDLLETSSINLQLREDMKKGVYVENLMEHEVSNVRDVVELLIRGAANRKMAATHMNSESSRSHSVFTCIIESRWDKDSMNHLRFARLNLVDLAGSERQKSSGAEGERLKEAANINKSLSTLGLVIMTLVDVAQGKHRHIPYRDSRLTFLLQDSLGGNSKTTIIANVSPSICSANETLSTLKFAQRAKLIQNNAKVNEDASGDVVALQREVQQLKGQLTILLKHHNLSSSSLLSCPRSEQSKSEDCHEDCEYSPDGRLLDDKKNIGLPESKIKCLEVALVGALRREEKAEAAVRKLEAEVERMNCLMQQREEDAQRTKLVLELTKEKIKRLELLADGLVSGDHYLMEENNDLSKEILLLRSKIDRNPELTQLALENMRLLDHLRVLEDFHKQGERETLLAEVSEMRYQLLEALERNHKPLPLYHKRVVQDTETLKDLEECKKNLSASIKCNAELTRVDELQKELKEYIECTNAACHSVADSLCGEGSIKHRNKYSTILHFKLSNPSLVTQEGNSVNSFFNKCEEAQATMKEADAMLNALLKANETAKHMTHDWKQAGEMLMIERASLVEEVRQLKASLYRKEEEYEFMQDQICSSLVDVTNSLSLLEGSFFQMQRDVEDWLKVIFSDIFSLRQDIWAHLHNSRSSLEDIWSSMMEYDIAFFVLYECYAGKRIAKVPIFKVDFSPFRNRQKECSSTSNNLDIKCMNTRENGSVVKGMFHLEGILERSQNKNPQEENSKPVNVQCTNYSCRAVAKLKEDELSESFDSLISENFSLKKELSRKDVILKGLLFDLSLLQESAASANDKKTEMEQFGEALAFVQHELAVKTNQLDDTLIQHKKLRMELDDCVAALTISNSELEHVQATVNTLSNQNTELRNLLDDLRVRKNSADQQLEETNEVVKCLEEEIIRLASSVEEKNLTSIEDIEDDLRRVSVERDCLYEEVMSLNRKLEMANALAEENEAIAIEARQESEASKIYAEQKQEEVKILENSVGELECTVDVLEKKVYEMGKEVEGHRRMRDCLEVELQALRQRMLTVETAAENMDSGTSNVEDHEEDQTSKHIDNGVFERIRFLEMEKADHAEEIKQCKEYISELLLHAEAQAKQYQQKYKALEDMVRELKSDPSTSTSAASLTLDKSEKTATRSRGSSSPFRCIASLVQQMNSEKDQELSMAKLRIEDLEALAAKRHKEVCVLSARLSAAENMTHDVIRDLLGVKLDITNYANLIEQDQIQKLLEEALRQTEESVAMEQEIIKLRRKINDLTVESESFVEEIKAREADILAAQLTVEQLHQRDQLLAAQNKMLEMENISLKRRSADLDEMLKEVLGSQNVHQYIPQPPKEQNPSRAGNRERCKRLAYSQKLPSRLNDELARYSKSNNINSKGDELRQRIRRQESKD